MRNRWSMLGARLGIAYCVAGFVLVFLGWNGAASYNRTFEQTPYIISGGLAGLALVVLGSALIVAQSLRTDRVELRASIEELRAAIERIAVDRAASAPLASAPSGDTVVATGSSYHRPSCTVVQGQAAVEVISLEEAVSSERTPCRICAPDAA